MMEKINIRSMSFAEDKAWLWFAGLTFGFLIGYLIFELIPHVFP